MIKKRSTGVPAVAQWVNDPACPCREAASIPSPVQWVKDLALLCPWHRSQLQLRFNPWPGEPPYGTGAAEEKKNFNKEKPRAKQFHR